MEWTYKEDHDAYFIGNQFNGCGVFVDGDGWTANVVHHNVDNIGWFQTKEEAMQAAIKEWRELNKQEGVDIEDIHDVC